MIRIARNTRVEQVGEKSHLWRLGFADVVWCWWEGRLNVFCYIHH